MDLIRIGSFLAELRHEKGLTQQALGERLGVTNKTISRWETGCYLPDVEMLSLLSREFGVSINELVAGERLVAEDFKKAADENLVTALDHSTFTLKEKQAFFKKKWRREHLSTFIFCAVAWLVLMIVLRIRHVEPELCGAVSGCRTSALSHAARSTVTQKRRPVTGRRFFFAPLRIDGWGLPASQAPQ